MATIPDSLMIGISTPHSRRGVLFESWHKWWGQPGGPLVWKASTERMNPTINKKLIEEGFRDDPQFALSEWLAEWRKDVEAFLPEEAVEQVTIPGRYELPPVQNFAYQAFCDPSGGRQDSFTLGIAHNDRGKIILDLVRETKPPFSPEAVVKEFSDILKAYGIGEVVADRYAGSWVEEAFLKNGIGFDPCEKSKSELYLNFLPMVQNQSVELLDHQKLGVQLASLERRTRPGGKDLVDVFFGHDDLANAAAGACFLAKEESEEFGETLVLGGTKEERWEQEMIAKVVPSLREAEERPEFKALKNRSIAAKYIELMREYDNDMNKVAKKMGIDPAILREFVSSNLDFIREGSRPSLEADE